MLNSFFYEIKKNLQKKFKNLTHFFFFLLYGKITKVVKYTDSKDIQTASVEKDKIFYKIFTVSNGRFYTDNVGDAAVIIKNQIVEGPSYQFRSLTSFLDVFASSCFFANSRLFF